MKCITKFRKLDFKKYFWNLRSRRLMELKSILGDFAQERCLIKPEV